MKFAKYLTAFSVFSVVAGVTLPANAISLGNGFNDISSSVSDIREGSNESDTQIFFFEEKTNHVLGSDVTVDASPPDDIGKVLQALEGTEATISSGETVNSYYFQFDDLAQSNSAQAGSDSPNGDVGDFTATFDGKILGLIYEGNNGSESASLENSNNELGLSSVDYPDEDANGNFLGIEGNGTDQVEFKDQNTVVFQSITSGNNNTDDVRIVTQSQAVPFEAEGTMGLVALGGFFGYRHLKNRKKRNQTLSQESN